MSNDRSSDERVGFTGTQRGMTNPQHISVRTVLAWRRPRGEFHHGDCIGADDQSARIARELGFWIVRHPPIIDAKRAFSVFDEDRAPKEYLDRNHDIVDETNVLVAAPGEETEQLRSGTWATIRYARRLKRRMVIVFPSGEILE